MQNQILEGFRLSPQQKRLWSLQEDSSAYCAYCAIRLEGHLNYDVLKAAVENVVNRHEILRTTFHKRPGIKIPIQVIADNSAPFWQTIHLSHLSFREQLAKIEELFQEEKCFIFNLQEPLLRLTLLILSENQHILLVSLPSLCVDSWSLKNLVQEIADAYALCLKSEELSDEVIQYIQFSEWQNELLEEEDSETGIAYWQQQKLSSLPLLIPFQVKSSKQTKFFPAIYTCKFSQNILANVQEKVILYNTKMTDFLLSCWQTLLWRLTGESEIVVSTVFNGRKYEELQKSLGLLAKWLPVRCRFQENFKFSEIVRQTDETLREIDKWQEYFIWEENADTMDSAVNPVSFEFENWSDKYNAGGISLSVIKQYVCFDRFTVKLSCVQTQDSLTAEFHYNPELFARESIQYLAEQFQTLVESAVNHPESTVSELEILSDRQRQQLLVEFNNTRTHDLQDKCIHQLFEAQVEKTPHNIAVIFEDQQLTYSELNARANQLAHYLQRLGVGPEVLVGIYAERSPLIIIAILGILKAGGAYLPFDPTLPAQGLTFRLQDTQAPVLLTQQSLVETLPESATRVVCLDTNWEVIDQESTANPTSKVHSENLVYTLFTSGSTGEPKGVAVEHRQLLNYLQAILDRLNLSACASFATISTFAADLGNTVIFPALCTGGCLHIIAQERASDPDALAAYFRRHPIDCLKIVPSHLTALLRNSASESILPRQCLVLGGEAASWQLIEQIQQLAPCRIINHYGPTEATVGVLTYAVKEQNQTQTVPLGRPLANTQVYVLDQHLRPVPIGVPGEVYIGGDGLARGYWNRPELTAQRFITNPFKSESRLYKTADLARYLLDGNLEFLGRVDSQVKIRGFRIELGEIEAVLSEHPTVRQAVVLDREDIPGDKRLVAYLVPDQKQKPTNTELRNFLKEKLPEYMIPSAFVMLKVLPLNPNGKVNRQELSALELTRPELEETFVAPSTPAEEVVAQIWKQVLGVERVGIHDNFFELGGHSLLATQVISRVREDFQVELPLVNLFKCPTVEGLVNAIAQIYGEREVVEEIAQILRND